MIEPRGRRARAAGSVVVLFVFVDGIGVGRDDPAENPLAGTAQLLARFALAPDGPLPGGGAAGRADPRLGVPGRPQSATGHATILSGTNAPAALGAHLLGFPNAPLRALLRRENLFLSLVGRGRRVAFANAFGTAFLRALALPHEAVEGEEAELPAALRRRVRPAATVVAAEAAGLHFRTTRELRAGDAVSADLTGELLRARGLDVPARTPEEAAAALLRLGTGHELVMFEHFAADDAGHAQSFSQARSVLGELDRFLRALVEGLSPQDALLVTSDHGNVEALGTRNHTLADVPVLGFGRAAAEVPRVRALTDVRPALERLVEAT